MPRPFSSFHPRVLVAAIALASLPLAASAEHYQLPAAPLASTLSRIASDAGLVLSIDPALTAGKTAPALQGDYTSLAALSAALQGSGLQLLQSSAGTYSLAPLAQDAMSLPTSSINARAQADGAAELGYRSEAVRNVGALGAMRLQDTPYSMSVVSKEFLQNTQSTSTDDVFKR
ncbi:MAG: STN domain-containing protein, partial [Pseudomonas sp.]|nr:STN domain-containing protein [Pseudomonas sp.]